MHCESKIRSQIGVARLCCGLLIHILKLKWFIEAYVKIIFVKLIFKIFTLEISKKKGPYIFPRQGIQPLPIVPVGSSSQHSIFSPEQIAYLHRLCRKKKLTAKKTKRLNLIQK